MHLDVVRPELWSLLRELMAWPPLNDFVLVGGTSLALRSGYRESVDLDLFCHPDFDLELLRDQLQASFPDFSLTSASPAGLFSTFGGVKVDFVKHRQPWLSPCDELDGLRLVALDDLAAMKVNAVMGRGSKKDFSDLLYLNDNGLPLAYAVGHFAKKYSNDTVFSAIRSLNYFGETDGEFDPLYRNGWTWPLVRQRMSGLAAALTHPDSRLKDHA